MLKVAIYNHNTEEPSLNEYLPISFRALMRNIEAIVRKDPSLAIHQDHNEKDNYVDIQVRAGDAIIDRYRVTTDDGTPVIRKDPFVEAASRSFETANRNRFNPAEFVASWAEERPAPLFRNAEEYALGQVRRRREAFNRAIEARHHEGPDLATPRRNGYPFYERMVRFGEEILSQEEQEREQGIEASQRQQAELDRLLENWVGTRRERQEGRSIERAPEQSEPTMRDLYESMRTSAQEAARRIAQRVTQEMADAANFPLEDVRIENPRRVNFNTHYPADEATNPANNEENVAPPVHPGVRIEEVQLGDPIVTPGPRGIQVVHYEGASILSPQELLTPSEISAALGPIESPLSNGRIPWYVNGTFTVAEGASSVDVSIDSLSETLPIRGSNTIDPAPLTVDNIPEDVIVWSDTPRTIPWPLPDGGDCPI